ncbi:protein of unknown function (plasmid) [Beijerinckiaceae bacterium RH AL1]|nr:protein of unknown function [Beijerinckiaceae bacterium RH AL1]
MSLQKQLRRTWDYVETIGQAEDKSGVQAALLNVASQFGLTTVFGGLVPTERLSRPEIDARILLQHFPPEWAVNRLAMLTPDRRPTLTPLLPLARALQ